jgi:hypothetical protein
MKEASIVPLAPLALHMCAETEYDVLQLKRLSRKNLGKIAFVTNSVPVNCNGWVFGGGSHFDWKSS